MANVFWKESHSRPFDVAEPSPLDFYLGITSPRGIADLASDMLPFEIAVGPDNKGTGIASLGLNIGGNCLLFLRRGVSRASCGRIPERLASSTWVSTGALNRLSGGGCFQLE